MTSTRNPLEDFILTPQQQNLLFAALNSNRQPGGSLVNGATNLSPSSLTTSPVQAKGVDGFEDSPFLDYDYDFSADTSFDFSFGNDGQPKMIGDLPGPKPATAKPDFDNNDNEKRSHPNDDEDEEGDAKRRESGEKIPKKPGRKPLLTEPTSKRKAQNRAAQRAFRERKEKHLKDLETKVHELEKASESANHENSLLRTQIEKLTVELTEYKKRLSLVTTTRPTMPPGNHPTFGSPVINNLNDVNFQFEFPKFGVLPGATPAGSNSSNSATKLQTKPQSPASTRSSSEQVAPADKANPLGSMAMSYPNGLDEQTGNGIAKFSGIFSPPLTSNTVASASRASMDSHYSTGPTTTSSPSASSNSNVNGASSSCGTSPEPSTQSPMGFKPVDALTTIGEEQQPSIANANQGLGHFANIDTNDINFLASQNDFQFDPQLFGNYREPQDNILGNTAFDDNFFNDAFDADFPTPYNTAPSPVTQKKDLMAQIEATQKAEDQAEVLTADGELLTCNKIWEKLQNCPRVQSGDFDLDGLCSDLQKKAKCSGSGAVVNEQDFKTVMKKYLGKTDAELEAGCLGEKL